MSALRFVLPDGREVGITDHLIDRWEEVCPVASRTEAVERLTQWLALAGGLVDTPPDWIVPHPARDEDEHKPTGEWIVAGDFAIPIYRVRSRLYAPTLLSRGGLTTRERQSRNEQARVDRKNRARAHRRTAAIEARSGARRDRRDRRAPSADDQDSG